MVNLSYNAYASGTDGDADTEYDGDLLDEKEGLDGEDAEDAGILDGSEDDDEEM